MKLSLRKISLVVICALIIAVMIGGAIYEQRPQFFPYVAMQAAEPLQIRFIQNSMPSEPRCEARVKRVTEAMQRKCPGCRLLEARCLEKLDPRQRKILYGQPVDVPTMRMPEGAIAFISATPWLALQTCHESAAQTARIVPGRRDCSPPSFETLNLSVSSAMRTTQPTDSFVLPSIVLIAAVIAFLICLIIIRSDKIHSWFSHDSTDSGPQKFHAVAVARIGGIAIAGALAGSLFLIDSKNWLRPTAVGGLFMLSLAAIPAFAGGLGEDVTKQVGVLARLMLTITAGVIASLLVGATLDRLDIPGFDTLLHWPLFAIAFTSFAVGGVANAINIIDGYHGLVAGYAILVLTAIAYVAFQVGDPAVLSGSLIMLGALLGFMVWNYPRGRIFLGDGGAYLLGFWLAELAVLLVARNTDVSPWFPLLLLIYPVFETLFSIYRRCFLHGHSSGYADALHFHQLIYKRLTRISVGSKDPKEITRRNSAVAWYIWIAMGLFILPSLFLWDNTPALVALTLIFCFGYLFLYFRITRWRAPTWMIYSPSIRES
jgi:UDP-N-acetylmuramyl pentapeptide phosphotransferase/UDP-N-acetylglucosamine-1-phosphate transferase